MLAAVGFEICHVYTDQAHGDAPRKCFAKVLLLPREFAFVIARLRQSHRLVRRKMVHIPDAQPNRSCLPPVFAQRRADSLAQIFDKPARNSVSIVPPSIVVSRDTDFGVEGSITSRPSSPRARSQIVLNHFAKRRFQSGSRHQP